MLRSQNYLHLDYGVLGSDGFLTYLGYVLAPANLNESRTEWQEGHMSLNATGLFRPVFSALGKDKATVRLDNVRLRHMDCKTTSK